MSLSLKAERTRNWVVGAFLIGLLAIPVTDQAKAPIDILVVSVGMAICFALIALACATMRNRVVSKPTRTCLPLNEKFATRSAVFFFSTLAALGLRLLGFTGLIPMIIGFIPAFLIIGGSQPRTLDQ